jgi:TPP-dependent trihydroxycyclohexane-1,2-dione (THcHDO) dehydratase
VRRHWLPTAAHDADLAIDRSRYADFTTASKTAENPAVRFVNTGRNSTPCTRNSMVADAQAHRRGQ